MPGFIRQKAPLPMREPSAKKSAAAPSKKRSAPVELASSPSKPTSISSKTIDLTTSAKPTSKKRPNPGSPTSPSEDTTANNAQAKKTRTHSPASTASTTFSAPPKPLSPREAPIPSSLPANGSDYIHDPSGLLPSLMESCNVVTMQIISSSKMSAKIARSLETLVLGKINLADVKCKAGLVVMYAKAATASKLVSVVEVVKREIGQKGEKWYQYNSLSETMLVIPRKSPKPARSDNKKAQEKGDAIEIDGEDEAYFETMKTKQERVLEGTDKLRAVPVLTVYLSRMPIEKLRVKYGEQTNAKK